MKFIKPSEISSKIMTLIDESDQFVVLITPYVKINNWNKLIRKFERLKERNIPFLFFIRDEEDNKAFYELENQSYKYVAISNLHCKLYLNEKYAIVSSMNLHSSSDEKSLEIAYQTENQIEYQELKDFCNRYLNFDFNFINDYNKNTKSNKVKNINGNWKDYVYYTLSEKLNTNIKVDKYDSAFKINTGRNNYESFIWSEKKNYLRISGILSSREYAYLSENKNELILRNLEIEIYNGKKGYYDTIWGTSKRSLESQFIGSLIEEEKLYVSDSIIEFVVLVDELKDKIRKIDYPDKF